MAGKTMILPTCHDPHECFAKAGNLCTALRDTYPRGTPCPFRKTYEENILVNGIEQDTGGDSRDEGTAGTRGGR